MASSEVPIEIITEILYYLPAKSICRFRCVSKDWLLLLSSPQFIKTHQNTLHRNHLIYVSYADHSLYSVPLDHHENPPTKLHSNSQYVYFINLYGSCNGLVLVSTYDVMRIILKLVVLNPVTRELTEIPESWYEVIGNRLILHGFGYDNVTDDYKVVTISYFCNCYPIHPHNMYVDIYRLRVNTWTRVIDTAHDHSFQKTLPGVFVNGFLHWFATKRSDGLPIIVAFSMASEKFNEVPSPDDDIVTMDGCKLVALGGKLAIFSKVEGEVWLMNEYGVKESWTKILLHEFPMLFRPMIFDNTGKILVVGDNQILTYDVEERRFSKRVKFSHNLRLTIQGSYVESLVSPKLTRTNWKSVNSRKRKYISSN